MLMSHILIFPRFSPGMLNAYVTYFDISCIQPRYASFHKVYVTDSDISKIFFDF